MTFSEYGINIPAGRISGEVQMTCPKCSHTRKKKQDKCLSVNLDKKTWYCHHCQWSGGLKLKMEVVKYEVPEWSNNTELPDSVLKWFESRRISAETLVKMKVTAGTEFKPQIGKEVNVIQFNYFVDGQLKNIKYRDGAKNFKLYKGAELVLYNLDAIEDEVWIVEGEMDCLSMIEAGITSCVSVPNGAGNNLQYLDGYIDRFDGKKIHICTDNDLKGRELREALANRFGKERCDYVVFDDCKDANEYLILNGKIKLAEAARNFTEFPMEGVFTVQDIKDSIFDLYFNGLPEGERTGMHHFDALLRFQKGYLTTITGIPGHGKSDFLDQILIKLHQRVGWRGAYYSPENRPTQLHFSKLARKLTLKGWYGHDKMTEQELVWAMSLLNENFYFIKPENGFTLETILQHVAMLKNRKGIDWFVIDAWNKLEHLNTESETKYIGQSLDKLVMFCEKYDVHCFLVAHPVKIRKDKETGLHEIPNLYDISGSANFFNKTDNGITIYRNMANNNTEVHVQKVKFSHWGEVGMCKFKYDKITGTYIETI